MIFIIQDKYEDSNKIVASRAMKEDAEKLVRDLEEFDREEDEYEPDRYTVSKRDYCFHEHSGICGNCVTGICLLEHPEKECPLVARRAAADNEHAAPAADPVLAPAAGQVLAPGA